MELREKLEKLRRNGITLDISGSAEYKRGGTRFGGRPDVPRGFEWPTFDCSENTKKEKKGIFSFLSQNKGKSNESKASGARPLSFIAQFDCAMLAKYDTERLLPDRGVLSFFYEMDSMRWGFAPNDKGCARVYWFEDSAALEEAEFPEDLADDFRFPALDIKMRAEPSFPCWEDFSEIYPDETDDDEGDEFDTLRAELGDGGGDDENRSKLLGWADTIQGSMPIECELVTRGHYLGRKVNISEDEFEKAQKEAQDKWLPLFQLDTVEDGDFELMFGDCGRLYFYITRDDLAARRFENVWLILQCY